MLITGNKNTKKQLGYRSADLTLQQKILLSLKMLESGCFQGFSKDFSSVSQSTVNNVLSAFCKVAPNFI